MKNFFISAIVLSFLLTSDISIAQDFNFSQFENSPTFLNPGSIGVFDGQHRIILNSATQSYQTINNPNRNVISLSYDSRFKISKDGSLGAGFNFITDSDNLASSSSDQYKLTGSYIHNLSKDSIATNSISIGIDFGITQRKIDLTEAQWPSQHDGNGGFDPDLQGNIADNYFHSDFAIGLLWSKKMKNENAFQLGVAMHHVNNPTITFFGQDSKLTKRYTIHGSGEIRATKKLAFVPSGFYLSQGSISQLMLGGSTKLYFKEGSKLKFLQVGLWRKTLSVTNTSIDLNMYTYLIQTQFQNLNLGLSYDTLNDNILLDRGLELSLRYTFN